MKSLFVKDTQSIINPKLGTQTTLQKFRSRLKQGKPTRDQNPYTHFCVYFAAFNPQAKQIFIGHHIKSGLWLVNGGHVDKGESLQQTLNREMQEEWGFVIKTDATKPSLLTITKIKSVVKITCEYHYDVWYFVPVEKNTFSPNKKLLQKEFHATGWKTIPQARSLIEDPNTLQALNLLEKLS